MGRKHRKWNELDLSEKLGYYWVGLFAILVFATSVAIFIPIVEDWIEEAEYSISDEGIADAAADDDYDYDYDYDDEEDDGDYDDDSEDEEGEEADD
jgi:hypothetical protein